MLYMKFVVHSEILEQEKNEILNDDGLINEGLKLCQDLGAYNQLSAQDLEPVNASSKFSWSFVDQILWWNKLANRSIYGRHKLLVGVCVSFYKLE